MVRKRFSVLFQYFIHIFHDVSSNARTCSWRANRANAYANGIQPTFYTFHPDMSVTIFILIGFLNRRPLCAKLMKNYSQIYTQLQKGFITEIVPYKTVFIYRTSPKLGGVERKAQKPLTVVCHRASSEIYRRSWNVIRKFGFIRYENAYLSNFIF